VIRVNGRDVEDRDGATIAELLADLGVDADARGVAVAVDGEVVPQGAWPTFAVAAGSRVEAVTAVQGG
jgi:sulfur carrier protein